MHLHECAGLASAVEKACSILSPPKPSCWCRARTTASTSFLSSPAGSWARLATSGASRVSRSLVVIRARSSEGNRCEKGLVSKSGSTCSRSVMGCGGGAAHRGGAQLLTAAILSFPRRRVELERGASTRRAADDCPSQLRPSATPPSHPTARDWETSEPRAHPRGELGGLGALAASAGLELRP